MTAGLASQAHAQTLLAVGGYHTCVVSAGVPQCVGLDEEDESSVPADLGPVIAISAGINGTCVIQEGGKPRCWGYPGYGATTIPGDVDTVTAVSAGYTHTCAIKPDGTPRCWGDNEYEQSTIPDGVDKVTAISAGEYVTCAIDLEGSPRCWGRGEFGETTIPGDVGKVTAISAGGTHVCAIEVGGAPRCWGGGSTVPEGIDNLTTISAGELDDCAVKDDGTPVCWSAYDGRNDYPFATVPPDVTAVTAIGAGVYHTCAITTDGTPTCWGWDTTGGMDIGPGRPGKPSAPTVDPSGVHWDAVDGATSYRVQHRDADDAKWSDMDYFHTSGTEYSFADEPESEGTWTYRVIAVDDHGGGEPSEPSQPLTIDGSAPTQPTAAPDRDPEDGAGGWFKDSVTVTLSGSTDDPLPDGSGSLSYDGPFTITDAGSTTVQGHATDAGGNTSPDSDPLTVKVDRDAPTITISGCPASGDVVAQGSALSLSVTANDPDPGSGLGDDPSGTQTPDTSVLGPQSVTYTAVDRVGHTASATCDYVVDSAPAAPGAPNAGAPGNGNISLSWAPSATPGVTYAIDRRPAAGGDWQTVKSDIRTSFYKFSGADSQPDGRWAYRVTAHDAYLASPPSDSSAVKVIDTRAPAAPTLKLTAVQTSPAYSDAGVSWYRDRVSIDLTGHGDPVLADGSPGSGLKTIASPFIWRTDGLKQVAKTVVDVAGNRSAPGTLTVAVDRNKPTVLLACPPRAVRLGSTATAKFTASDSASGIHGPADGTVALDTATTGRRKASVTVLDNVGHSATATCGYTVS